MVQSKWRGGEQGEGSGYGDEDNKDENNSGEREVEGSKNEDNEDEDEDNMERRWTKTSTRKTSTGLNKVAVKVFYLRQHLRVDNYCTGEYIQCCKSFVLTADVFVTFFYKERIVWWAWQNVYWRTTYCTVLFSETFREFELWIMWRTTTFLCSFDLTVSSYGIQMSLTIANTRWLCWSTKTTGHLWTRQLGWWFRTGFSCIV